MVLMEKKDRAHAIAVLDQMGLNQIADWIKALPDHKWERMFLSRWPTLAKKCGISETE
ncbi:MAG: hypothetical protein K0R57_5597 [Paenibacillaceae bacterium]|nr:hypothetical protein [Paenibacillaceae bacterium]